MACRLRAAAAAVALATLAAQAPASAQSPLPVIGRTRSKGFCAVVREAVAPAVAGLMKTDDLIGAGHRAALKTAHDQAAAPEAIELDRVYLEKVVSSMAHNLGVIKKVLADERRFPKTPATDDERFAQLMKTQLQAAADRQNEVLDHLNGLLETQQMHAMRTDVSTAMQSAVQSSGAPAVTGGFLDASSLPGAGPLPLGSSGGVAASTTHGKTIWDLAATDIDVQQHRIAQAEQTLTPTVVAASISCKAEAQPSPTAAP